MRKALVSAASKVWLRLDRQPRLVVLTFHRVGDGHPITRDHIRHHLTFLARHYEMISPTRLLAGNLPARAAMVTIDDSHRDLYEQIYPEARSLKVPITICVPTDYFFRRRWLWFDRLYWMLERTSSGAEARVNGQVLHAGHAPSVAGMKAYLKRLLPAEREAALDSLAGQLHCTPPPAPADGYEAVTGDEMREMLASGLTEICAHTVSHTIATVLPEPELRRELAHSKKELEEFAGREVRSFCYPNGEAGDFDDRTTRAVKETGFSMALTSVAGTNPSAGFDPYRILRIHAHRDPSSFEKEVSGLGDFQRRLAAARH